MDGKIRIIKNFLTEEECFNFIITYRKKVRRAGVINEEFSDYRRSKVFIWHKDSFLEKTMTALDKNLDQAEKFSKLFS